MPGYGRLVYCHGAAPASNHVRARPVRGVPVCRSLPPAPLLGLWLEFGWPHPARHGDGVADNLAFAGGGAAVT